MSLQELDPAPARPKRSGGIDAVRVVGVVAVVVGHVWVTGGIQLLVFPWHVPVFFFLTGYLWKRDRPFAVEWRNRVRSLGVPYVTWFVLVMVAFVGVAVVTHTFSLKVIAELTYGGYYAYRPFQTFWFVSALFFVALLYRPVSRLPFWGQWIVGLVALTVGVFAGPLLAKTPLSAGSAVTCLVFVIAGASLRRVRVPARLLVGLGLLVAAALLVGFRVSAPVDLKAGNFGTPYVSAVVAVAISFGLVLVAEGLFARLPSAASTVTTRLAVPALTVVLLHPVVLWIMRTGNGGDPVVFMLALVLPWVVGLIAVRTPASVLLTGVSSRPGRSSLRSRPLPSSRRLAPSRPPRQRR